MSLQQAVAAHYRRGDMIQRIEAALRRAGKDPAHPGIDDLAPVDEFHARGREATEELVRLLPQEIPTELLDIGSGLGGPARYLAATRGFRVVGIDLTPDYVAAANELSRRCGLADRVRFIAGDALDLPFPPESFAAAYTQHAAMNIADKERLYAGIARVLRPGAVFVIYDILKGQGEVRYPTPWSADGSTSSLVDLAALKDLLAQSGFAVLDHQERGAESLAWFEARAARAAAGGPPLGIHLLLGPLFEPAFKNLVANLRHGSVVPTFVRAVRA